MSFLLPLTYNICIYALLGLSLNLVLGYSGMLLLCEMTFFGVGAYTYAIVAGRYGVDFMTASLIAVLLGIAVAWLIGSVTTRLRGDSFAIATLGFQIIAISIFSNWVDLTGGPYGQRDIPPPRLGPWVVDSTAEHVLLAATFLALIYALCLMLLRLPYGKSLVAVRDDEVGAIAIGKNPKRLRLSTIIISGGIASQAGVIYAGYITYIDPSSFSLDDVILGLAVVIVGGSGTLYGPLIGAVVLGVLPELLRSLQLSESSAAATRQIIFGLLLIVLMRIRPQGIAGRYRFD